jgi:hypothetical protein
MLCRVENYCSSQHDAAYTQSIIKANNNNDTRWKHEIILENIRYICSNMYLHLPVKCNLLVVRKY